MTLTLRILQAPKGVATAEERRLEPAACPLSIGRGPDNDWVLDDPDRHVSKAHCRIEDDGEGFVLVDISSNGVFFASESKPMGRGKRRPIDAGDSFRIGEYRIGVARDAVARLPDVMDAPALSVAAGVGASGVSGVSGILAGDNDGTEIRASRSVTGAAGDWLGAVPGGAVDEQVAQPLGWHAPPSTIIRPTPEDSAEPLSDFASRSEHLPAVSGALRAPSAAQVLPMDWNLGGDAPAERAQAPSGTDWGAALAAMLEGATLGGLAPAGEGAEDGPEALRRAGQILRRLVDTLAAIEAVQRSTERDLALSEAEPSGEDMPTLVAMALSAPGDGEPADALVRRLASLARRGRAFGVAIGEAADEVGSQIRPEAIEEAARDSARLPVGPLLRAASWERYALIHANLAGGAEAPAAEAILAPLRRIFAQRA